MTALKKVLVVDDDPVVGKSFDRVLTGKGYAVITAASGQEALDRLAREDYDVVFTDIKMPGMSGIEVAERIKATRPWLPVVIVTGYGSDENQAKAKQAGVNAFLHKPLSPDMIEHSAQAALAPAPAAAPAAAELAVPAPAPAAAPAAGWRPATFAKNVALFLAAPFIGLAYVVALPFVGAAVLARMAFGAFFKREGRFVRFVKNAALFIGAPFIGLAYAVALPFVGLGLLARQGYRAFTKKTAAK
jgi:CheY-like chemotaxis protein